MKKIFQKFLDFFLNIFFPLTCVVCEKKGAEICESCLFQKKIYPKKVAFSEHENTISVSSFFLYSDEWVKKLIRKAKYKYSPEILRTLAFFISEKISEISPEMISELFPENSVLVPVPLHYFRQQKRGYNQSQILAEVFSEISGCSLSPLVKRIKHTPPQAKCSREERKINLHDAFAIDENILKILKTRIANNPQKNIKNLKIILIDDVVSTASTLLEIQKILKKSGFTDVSGVTVARGG